MVTNVANRSERGTEKGQQSLGASTDQRTRGSWVVVAEGFTCSDFFLGVHGVQQWLWHLDGEEADDRSQQGRRRLEMSSTRVALESVIRREKRRQA